MRHFPLITILLVLTTTPILPSPAWQDNKSDLDPLFKKAKQRCTDWVNLKLPLFVDKNITAKDVENDFIKLNKEIGGKEGLSTLVKREFEGNNDNQPIEDDEYVALLVAIWKEWRLGKTTDVKTVVGYQEVLKDLKDFQAKVRFK